MMADPAVYKLNIRSMEDLDLILPCLDGSLNTVIHMTMITDEQAREEMESPIFQGELRKALRVRERAICKINGCYYEAHCLGRR